MKKVLVVGAHSYIASSFMTYAKKNHPGEFAFEAVSVRDDDWRDLDLSGIDSILYAAGIVHRESDNLTDDEKRLYDKVNTDTPYEFAIKAKKAGVSQLVFISTMSVYPEDDGLSSKNIITPETKKSPVNYYGLSKLRAEEKIKELETAAFKTAIVRPPLVYGAGCKGKYVQLQKIARLVPVFPDYDNARSMIFIDDLCEFFSQLIMRGQGGEYHPQNSKPVSTSKLVKAISNASGKKVVVTKALSFLVPLGAGLFDPIGRLTRKAFGSMTYEASMSRYDGIEYQLTDFDESIHKTECL